MAKGDDALARKKNKSNRKKMNSKNDSSTVSARIASIIAAKKRRKSGKRSMCQGMCFSLPTPEDPFNERATKVEISKKKTKKVKTRDGLRDKGSFKSMEKENVRKDGTETSDQNEGDKRSRRETQVAEGDCKVGVQKSISENIDGPPKFLMVCLDKIESSFRTDVSFSDDDEKPLFLNTWGIEFWKSFMSGKDMLETSGTSSTWEQVAWIVSTAADAMARREKEEESLGNSPFLLFLVPSQSKASKVRSVCKPLKILGIHTVCLHQGASQDHQISGLKSCEPEFLVSTPERLLELVALKAVDLSDVSLLVIDELESLSNGGYLDAVNSIKQAISSKHQSIVFNDCSDISAIQSLLLGSVSRVSDSNSVASQSSCIIQSVSVCASEEKKLQKFAELLDSSSSKLLHVVTREKNFKKLKALLKLKGYSVSANSDSKSSEVKKCRKPLARLIDIDELDTRAVEEFETVVLPDFVPSIETYVQILTTMSRDSVHGVLHSFITEEEAASAAGPLVNVLEECGQNVPESLRNSTVPMSD